MDQNLSFLIGRLAADPQLKTYTKADGTEGYRCYFPLAVTRNMDRGAKRGEQRSNFIDIISWGDAGKQHAQFLRKGTEVNVVGEIYSESQRQEDGSYKRFFGVTARDIQYGQRSAKNSTPAQLQSRINSLNEVMERTQALANAAKAPAPASEPAPVGTEFEAPPLD